MIDVTIEGQTFELLLDLGTYSSALSEEIIEKVKLNKEPNYARTIDLFGKKSSYQGFNLYKILVGNYLLPHLEVNRLEEKWEDSTSKRLTHGHIGRKPFLDKVLLIDRKNQCCKVKSARVGKKPKLEKWQPGQWIEADLILDEELGIVLNLMIDSNEKKKLILDTGSNLSMLNEHSSFKKTISLKDKKEKMTLSLLNGTALGVVSFYLFDSSNTGLQGILGFDFFDHYIVCIDFLNKKVFLKQYD